VSCANFVTLEKGTGLVHSAPGHGHEDYLALLNSGALTKIFSPVDDEGRYSPEVCTFVAGDDGENLVGKDVIGEGTKAIVKILKAQGKFLSEEMKQHSYPYDWKTDKPVIVRYETLLLIITCFLIFILQGNGTMVHGYH
jgi:isoleucyl-tRNA synthetase